MRLIALRLSICCLLVAMAGCASAPEIQPTPSPALPLTVEPPPTATPLPTAAAYATVTPHVYCPGALPSILIVGERGRVTRTDDGRWLNLRAGPGTDNDVLAQLGPLEGFMVLDGVECDGPYAWYQIDYGGTLGWIAEGYDGQYYAEPWLPG